MSSDSLTTRLQNVVPEYWAAKGSELRSLGFVLVILVLLLYLVRLWALPRPIPGIPHRREGSRTIFGDIPALVKGTSKTGLTPLQWFQQQVEELQSPIIQILPPLARPVIILSDFGESQDILSRRCPKEFDRSYLAHDILSGPVPDFHFHMRTDAVFKAHKKLIQDLMTPAFLHKVTASAIHAKVLKLISVWEIKADIAGNRPFSAQKDIFEAVLDTLFSFAFGEDFPHSATEPKLRLLKALDASATEGLTSRKTDDEVIEFPVAKADDVVSSTLDYAAAIEQLEPWPPATRKFKWKLLALTRRMRRAQKIKDEYILVEVQRAVQKLLSSQGHHQEQEHGDTRCAVDLMVMREKRLAEKDGRDPDFFSPAMKGEIFGFITTGHDTIHVTLLWALKFLADNPDPQTQLRSALQASFPTAKSSRRNPSAQEISSTQIPYLDAVIEEILRCSGTTLALNREAMVDTQVMGHPIPKGTYVVMLTQGPSITSPALHIDDDRRSKSLPRDSKECAWDPRDLAVFKPERWLVPSNADSSEIKFDPNAGPILAFGSGTRGCFGRRLAYLDLRIYVTLIVWNFHLLKCPSHLSRYSSYLSVTNKPNDCYVRLRKVHFEGS